KAQQRRDRLRTVRQGDGVWRARREPFVSRVLFKRRLVETDFAGGQQLLKPGKQFNFGRSHSEGAAGASRNSFASAASISGTCTSTWWPIRLCALFTTTMVPSGR